MKIKYRITYWRDIPAHVRVRAGRKRVSRQLDKRFEVAIDQAAMNSGATSNDDYLTGWHNSEWQENDGDPETVAEALAVELEQAYPQDQLKALVKNGGRKNPRT